MNIIIIYQFFQSENQAGHSLTYNLAQYLSLKKNTVRVLCSKVGYMQGNSVYSSSKKILLKKTKRGSVKELRAWSYSGLNKNYAGRILNYLTFSISSAAIMLFFKKKDAVLISSPPLFSAFTTGLICFLRDIPFMLEVRDLWPTSLIELGAIKNSLIKNIMFLMEKFLYNKAHKIITLTEGIKRHLLNIGIPAEKVACIHCGVDLKKIYPDHKAGLIVRNEYGWNAKKVVMYFGALGEANNIEVIVRAALDLKHNNDIIFVLIGDGIMKEKTMQYISSLKLENILLLKAVPKNEARKFLNAADVCIVTLKNLKVFEGAIPTKLIDYMACAKPVLCGVKGEAEEIVQEAKCGYVFDPNNEKQLAHCLLKIISNKEEAVVMGKNGYKYVLKKFNINAFYQKYENIIKNSIANKKYPLP